MKTLESPTNTEAMERLFTLANAHDAEAVARMVHPDYLGESDTSPEPIRGRDGYRVALQGFWTSFPDMHYEIEEMIASNRTVVTRLQVTGTHRGDFAGHAGTGRKFTVRICHVDQFEDGLIKRAWFYWDFGIVMRQLGLA